MARSTRILVLALCAVLVAPLGAAAAPLPGRQMGDFLGWLHGAWSSLWLKGGCRLDPDGHCLDTQPAVPGTTENGCRLDPNGLCLKGAAAAAGTTEGGCRIDPDGLCSH
jgi:hypothetical protein